MCWALVVMYLRRQTRLQTDRHAQTYGPDMPSMPMGTDRNSALHTAHPDPHCLLVVRGRSHPLNEYFLTFLCIDDQFENELIGAIIQIN